MGKLRSSLAINFPMGEDLNYHKGGDDDDDDDDKCSFSWSQPLEQHNMSTAVVFK